MTAERPQPATEQYVEDDDPIDVRDRAVEIVYVVVAVIVVTLAMWLVVLPLAQDFAESFRGVVRSS